MEIWQNKHKVCPVSEDRVWLQIVGFRKEQATEKQTKTQVACEEMRELFMQIGN